jgi:dTDP-4-dehydrorhamnose reductase
MQVKKIIITGAAGMLGTAVIDHLMNFYSVTSTDQIIGFSPRGVRWHQMDLLEMDGLARWIRLEKPDAVVHCAALVNVDACEKDQDLAVRLHEGTTKTIGDVLQSYGGKLIYISTDSVFNGKKDKPYTEDDPVDPPNIYAKTKYNGEKATLTSAKNVVLRTNIFGWSRAEKLSFAEWVLKGLITNKQLTMFTDVFYSPIHVSHLAEIIREIISEDLCGLYHATGSTVLSKHEFAIKIACIFGLKPDSIIATSVEDANLIAKRPKNMALDNSMLSKSLKQRIPSVDDGLMLMKKQYDTGWVAAVKNRPTSIGYRFWEN